MKEIKHFSHEHPLTFFQDIQVQEYDDQKPYLCRICGLPILSSPSYTCTINTNCNFFLHEPCALQMPEWLTHPLHYHDNLHLQPELARPAGNSILHGCNYICSREFCNFKLHPLVAVPVEIKSKHKSHKEHSLVANGRETLCPCNACGEEHKGYFFSCQQCNFWIHQDCTLLPSIVKLPFHSHPFILTYSLPRYPPYYQSKVVNYASHCALCSRDRGVFHNAVYFCGQCNIFTHASCAKSNMENHESETRLDLIQLPSDDKWDTFPSLAIRRMLQTIKPTPHDNNLTIDHHNHPLILDDHTTSSTSSTNLNKEIMHCDLCIQPITNSSPFYKCLQPNCHFLVHNICAVLPSEVLVYPETKAHLSAYSPDPGQLFFCSTFDCYYCRRPCNGSCFRATMAYGFTFFVDLECAAAPSSIKHTSHSQHVLFQTSYGGSTPLTCCTSPCQSYYDVYRCISCDFYIHIGCALLPKATMHKFDEHPLELITTTSANHGRSHYYCEFCEEEIDNKYWFYGCGKCEQWFHIKCVPLVGYLSKVKFGKAFVDDNVHQHPLVLMRMLMLGIKERCEYCNKTVQGFVDEMAFCCLECDFWIHFLCAKDSSCAADELLESDVDSSSSEDYDNSDSSE